MASNNRCYDECITKGFTSEEASLLAHIHSIEPKNIKVKKGSIRDTMMGLKVLYYNISKTGEGKTLCVDIVEPNGRTDKGSTFGILDS